MKNKLGELVGKDLAGFQIVEMTEVYRVSDEGMHERTIGYFRNPNTANAFAGVQRDANWHKTGPALILTNGNTGYLMTQSEPVKLFDDEVEAIEVKKKALAKLTEAERKLLGLDG